MSFGDVNIVKVFTLIFLVIGVYALDKYLHRAFLRKPLNRQLSIMSKRFSFYRSFTPTSSIIKRIADMVKALNIYTDAEVRYNAVVFLESAMKFAIIVFVIILVGFRDMLSSFLGLLFVIVIINAKINSGIDSINTAQVDGMSVALSRLREAYIRTNSIPEAINSIQTPFVLTHQFQDIYRLLTTVNGDKQLTEFCKRTPNRLLRTFATACYLRNDAGDVEGSTFLDTISLIKDEVDSERIRLFNQQLMFKSLDRLPLMPIVAYPILVFAYTHIITATAGVFESFWGYIFKIVNILVSIVCYYIITMLNNSSVASVDDRSPFYTKLIEGTAEQLNKKSKDEFKFKDDIQIETFWSRLSKLLAPHDNKKYSVVKTKLGVALSAKSVEYMYLEKTGNMILFGALGLVCCVFITYASKITVYNSVQSTSMMSTFKMSPDQEKAVVEYDHEILKKPEAPSDLDRPDMTRMMTYLLHGATDMDISTQVDRLIAKYTTYHNLKYYWWFGIITVLAGLAGYYSPDFLLNLRTRSITDEAMRDVLQLQTVIAILTTTKLDTLSVVYWLMRSSDIHRYVLLDCFNKYTYQPEMSLLYMSRMSNIVEFSAIADKLRLAVYDIPLEDAFSDLVKDRNTVMKLRELAQQDELKNKRQQASPIAKAPMVVWMVTCFIAPIIIVTINSASTLLNKLSEIM